MAATGAVGSIAATIPGCTGAATYADAANNADSEVQTAHQPGSDAFLELFDFKLQAFHVTTLSRQTVALLKRETGWKLIHRFSPPFQDGLRFMGSSFLSSRLITKQLECQSTS